MKTIFMGSCLSDQIAKKNICSLEIISVKLVKSAKASCGQKTITTW